MRLNRTGKWVGVIGACVLLVGAVVLAARSFQGLSQVVALVGVGVVAAGLAFWALPRWQAEAARERGSTSDQFQLENEARKTLAQALGGLFLVIGLAATWQQLVATETEQRNAREVQLAASALEESGQITERYAKAVDQLASEDEVVALGAVHALSRIAEDSERDRVAVMRVLARWIQANAPISGGGAPPRGTPGAEPDAAPLSAAGSAPSLVDVVRALRVISDLQKGPNPDDPRPVVASCVDLSRVSLRGASLTGFDLRGMCLTDSDLTEVTLTEANLSHAVLTGADLTNATLTRADLSNSVLTGTRLLGAKVDDANFSDANFSGTDLRGADLGDVLKETLTKPQIDQGPIVDSETRLPVGLVLPPIATPVGTPRATPEPTPPPPPADFAPLEIVVVNADRTLLRAAPTRAATILREFSVGTRLTVIGTAQEADGLVWWPVESSAEAASEAVQVAQVQGTGRISGWVVGDDLSRFISATLTSAVWGGTPAQVTIEFGDDVRAWNADCSWYTYAMSLGLDACQYPAIAIALPRDTPLFAAEGGTVEFAGFDQFYRPNHVDIRTADGELHIYAHMWSVDANVVVGGQVAAGQYLGTSGEPTILGTMQPSGVGAFLFFEVRGEGGRLIDPRPILEDAPIVGESSATRLDDALTRFSADSGTERTPPDGPAGAPPSRDPLGTYARQRRRAIGRLRRARGLPPSG